MAEQGAPPFYVPVAVLFLVASVVVSVIAGDAHPGLRTAAMIAGGAIAIGLVLYKARSILKK
ncbi:hypothetical protein ACFY9Q_02420 [Streptomyces sp. NPDC012389]|uniref:hypothetical protein n=1 Tax=unclassified Streptomyces TaxID=2593676 RepID=UPI00081E97D6|nr:MULTISPECIES: hypothetical protein [unclassified Streptomyces]MYR97186.1 hypothetical protein [Streptomyces sp. SID4937]MYX13565.1 hypothetical protein [Streptomyces sp. SID8374]SCE21986.1 hypothetical protein GA0115243_1087108 [Streptomyces sp. ScaeMP-e83]